MYITLLYRCRLLSKVAQFAYLIGDVGTSTRIYLMSIDLMNEREFESYQAYASKVSPYLVSAPNACNDDVTKRIISDAIPKASHGPLGLAGIRGVAYGTCAAALQSAGRMHEALGMWCLAGFKVAIDSVIPQDRFNVPENVYNAQSDPSMSMPMIYDGRARFNIRSNDWRSVLIHLSNVDTSHIFEKFEGLKGGIHDCSGILGDMHEFMQWFLAQDRVDDAVSILKSLKDYCIGVNWLGCSDDISTMRQVPGDPDYLAMNGVGRTANVVPATSMCGQSTYYLGAIECMRGNMHRGEHLLDIAYHHVDHRRNNGIEITRTYHVVLCNVQRWLCMNIYIYIHVN